MDNVLLSIVNVIRYAYNSEHNQCIMILAVGVTFTLYNAQEDKQLNNSSHNLFILGCRLHLNDDTEYFKLNLSSQNKQTWSKHYKTNSWCNNKKFNRDSHQKVDLLLQFGGAFHIH